MGAIQEDIIVSKEEIEELINWWCDCYKEERTPEREEEIMKVLNSKKARKMMLMSCTA